MLLCRSNAVTQNTRPCHAAVLLTLIVGACRTLALTTMTTTSTNAAKPQHHLLQGVLFDMDGTLLDTEPLGCKAVYLTLKEKLSDQAQQDFVDRNFAMPWELKQQTLGLPDKKWPPIVLEYAQQYWGLTLETTPTVDEFLKDWDFHMHQGFSTVNTLVGAPELVQQFGQLEIPMAIATSSRSDAVQEKRKRHEDTIFQYMQTVVTTDHPSVQSGKPAPDIFLEAARRLDVDPKHCLVFEDGMTGCKAGKAAGCFVVAVPDRRTTAEEKTKFEQVADLVLEDLTQFDVQRFLASKREQPQSKLDT